MANETATQIGQCDLCRRLNDSRQMVPRDQWDAHWKAHIQARFDYRKRTGRIGRDLEQWRLPSEVTG